MDELPSSLAFGRTGEDAAADYLGRCKYRVVERGFRLFRGEIDIIAYDGLTLVFIEVKTRRQEDFGLPEEAVNAAKQRQIRKVAEGYLMVKNLPESRTPCRFDVLSVIPDDVRGFQVRHIKNAF